LGDNYFTIDSSEVAEIYDYRFYCKYKNSYVRLNCVYIHSGKNLVEISIDEDDYLPHLIDELGMNYIGYPDYRYWKDVNLDEITDITYEAVPRGKILPSIHPFAISDDLFK
jgi:hypothetical protein